MTKRPGEAEPDSLLSVSIVTYLIDQEEFSGTLQSLRTAVETFARREATPVDVSIIDNGGQEALLREMAEKFRTESCRFRVIGGLNNLGYGRAHNLAILTTPARYHLILNPDVMLAPDCLVRGVDFLRGNAQVKAVAPFATDRQGKVQYLCKSFPSLLDLGLRGFAPGFLKKIFARRLLNYELKEIVEKGEVALNVPLLSGCFMLCETALLKKVGGFDERFFLYFEDFALSMELRRHGFLAYLPDMKIQHFGGNSARKGLNHIRMFTASAIKFFNTYGWKLI